MFRMFAQGHFQIYWAISLQRSIHKLCRSLDECDWITPALLGSLKTCTYEVLGSHLDHITGCTANLLLLVKHHAMKANRVVKMQLYAFLTSTLDTELSVLRPSSFAPRDSTPVTFCMWGWVCPRASVDVIVRRTFLGSRSIPIVQPLA